MYIYFVKVFSILFFKLILNYILLFFIVLLTILIVVSMKNCKSFLKTIPICKQKTFWYPEITKMDQALRKSFVSTNSRCPSDSARVWRPFAVRTVIFTSSLPA